jgi:Glycosyl transferase family 2
MAFEDTNHPVVLVLVGHQYAEVLVCLALEGLQQPPELVDPVDGRDDKVQSHGRTLTPVPLVSVLLAVHDDARFLREAVDSVLRQTLGDLELLVIDDASTDDTPDVLAGVDDPRLVVLRNDAQSGLAASLNRGLDQANGKYVARLDADDVALPERLERQADLMRADSGTAVVGTAIADLDEHGHRGRTHALPQRARALRWHALFSSPFFHPTVLVDRETLAAHGLRYDPAFLESEDYDLWTRLFEFADGYNLAEPLVLKRVHAGQASLRRGDVQESFQRQVALREIARVAPDVDADAAWRIGARKPARRGARKEFLSLLTAFERKCGRGAEVRKAAFRALLSPRRRK